jgi:hypothetical protein
MIKKILLYCLGYLACLFEGETALTTSAFAAHRGYLEIFLKNKKWVAGRLALDSQANRKILEYRSMR